MKFAVVGVGSIGSLYVEYLRGAGHEVVTADPFRKADAADVEDLTAGLDKNAMPAAWVVAAPTEVHLQTVGKILNADRGARILLEKPACFPGELGALRDLCRRHPDAGVLVNDVYEHSRVVRLFTDTVRSTGAPRDISRVVVEFTKNRGLDQDRGRFVDHGYGEVGYEWFHMLSLLRAVLPPAEYARYLETARLCPPPDLRVCMTEQGLPRIDLHTSMSGRIAFAESAGFAYRGDEARRCLDRAVIPYASPFRYRFARVEFTSKASVTLAFESGFGSTNDDKNTHSVHVCNGLSRQSFTIVGNQLSQALFSQLHALLKKPRGLVELRSREHEHMAAMALQLKNRDWCPAVLDTAEVPCA